ncbi:Putative NACHT nucleoside triphosphatase, P-loop containing nucleoside triphosphate hydrolase [Septoria linicola]|uniref:NACHT nucleoside triphosphatase, P-loop containing nucleoside triphosphate hydrolase n=1 Tax=Septoria linicola TaxID=215465 RepID=A0A9Q9AJ98_9PEZI|nr:Putative NACHT nucleoside triphosphatase, P-loop containing nucleoside triphosphate hydrolase [Septoria linicola]
MAAQHIGDNTWGDNHITRLDNLRIGHQYGGTVNHYHGASIELGAEEEGNYDRIRKAIYQTDPIVDRANLIRSKGIRTTGTCRWILENETYLRWFRGEFRVLCVTGGPGKGKTMLADFLVEEMNRNEAVLSYFFCSSSDAMHDNLISILRGLIWQMLLRYPEVCRSVSSYFTAVESTAATVFSADALWNILTTISESCQATVMTCLIDGLDECESETQATLSSLLAATCPAFGPFTHIKLDPDNDSQTNKDIVSYIDEKVAELAQVVYLGAVTQSKLRTDLAERAGGHCTVGWVRSVRAEETAHKVTDVGDHVADAAWSAGVLRAHAEAHTKLAEIAMCQDLTLGDSGTRGSDGRRFGGYSNTDFG